MLWPSWHRTHRIKQCIELCCYPLHWSENGWYWIIKENDLFIVFEGHVVTICIGVWIWAYIRMVKRWKRVPSSLRILSSSSWRGKVVWRRSGRPSASSCSRRGQSTTPAWPRGRYEMNWQIWDTGVYLYALSLLCPYHISSITVACRLVLYLALACLMPLFWTYFLILHFYWPSSNIVGLPLQYANIQYILIFVPQEKVSALEGQANQLSLQASQECERLAKDRNLTLQMLQKVQLLLYNVTGPVVHNVVQVL